MIQPISDSEKLLFTTLMVYSEGSIGTGFIFSFQDSEKSSSIPVLITNKHVINNKEELTTEIILHTGSADFKRVHDENFRTVWTNSWIHHPTQDLCCTPLQPLIDQMAKQGKHAFYRNFSEELIPKDSDLGELNAVEDVIMIGYPNAHYDTKNNLPIVRKGITATHPAIGFENEPKGLVDMTCIAGSSGSPILIYNQGSFTDKQGVTTIGSRRILLGILFGTFYQNLEGEVFEKEVPTKTVSGTSMQVPINIGIYIKAEEILTLKRLLFEKYKIA
ncbi:MAG: serine protease [Candidatus Dojkabacteria bacterium]|nr:serine protease [Candidatus Dojkabacteria bacterium]MDD4560996.1 serine protease [Candidatus Dojkabacteria bacterium]